MTTMDDLRKDGFGAPEWDDPFEDLAGPYLFRKNEGASTEAAFVVEKRHTNGSGAIHGGMMMAFADTALFSIAEQALQENSAVTLTFNCEFVGPAYVGELITCRGDIVNETRKTIFVRGQLMAEDRIMLNFSGVLRKVPKDVFGDHTQKKDEPKA